MTSGGPDSCSRSPGRRRSSCSLRVAAGALARRRGGGWPRPCSFPRGRGRGALRGRCLHAASSAAFSPTIPPTAAVAGARSWRSSLVAAGVAWERVRARRTRAALARLVVDLGASPSAGGLARAARGHARRPVAAAALQPRRRRRLDRRRRPDARATHRTRGAARPRRSSPAAVEIAAVVHRRGLLDDPALAEEIAAAARLALEHERLHALAPRPPGELRLACADRRDRRRRAPTARARSPRRRPATPRHARARRPARPPPARRRRAGARRRTRRVPSEELHAAVGELRELAHGLFPAVLADEGLGAGARGACRARAAARRPGAARGALHGAGRVGRLLPRRRDAAARRRRRPRGRRPAPATGGSSSTSRARASSRARRPSSRIASAPLGGDADRRPASPARGVAVRVVIADDEVLLRDGLARLLEDAGFEVVGPLRRRRRAAAHGRRAPARRRARRHPHAAPPRRRRPASPPRRSAAGTPRSAFSCSHTTSSRATRCGCSRRLPERAGYLLKERVSDSPCSPTRCSASTRASA